MLALMFYLFIKIAYSTLSALFTCIIAFVICAQRIDLFFYSRIRNTARISLRFLKLVTEYYVPLFKIHSNIYNSPVS